MPPSKNKKRYEVHLDKKLAEKIEKLATKEGRSVKNWMELQILKKLKNV
jgi:predicted HicB family RNase H-like nuclease